MSTTPREPRPPTNAKTFDRPMGSPGMASSQTASGWDWKWGRLAIEVRSRSANATSPVVPLTLGQPTISIAAARTNGRQPSVVPMARASCPRCVNGLTQADQVKRKAIQALVSALRDHEQVLDHDRAYVAPVVGRLQSEDHPGLHEPMLVGGEVGRLLREALNAKRVAELSAAIARVAVLVHVPLGRLEQVADPGAGPEHLLGFVKSLQQRRVQSGGRLRRPSEDKGSPAVAGVSADRGAAVKLDQVACAHSRITARNLDLALTADRGDHPEVREPGKADGIRRHGVEHALEVEIASLRRSRPGGQSVTRVDDAGLEQFGCRP